MRLFGNDNVICVGRKTPRSLKKKKKTVAFQSLIELNPISFFFRKPTLIRGKKKKLDIHHSHKTIILNTYSVLTINLGLTHTLNPYFIARLGVARLWHAYCIFFFVKGSWKFHMYVDVWLPIVCMCQFSFIHINTYTHPQTVRSHSSVQ